MVEFDNGHSRSQYAFNVVYVSRRFFFLCGLQRESVSEEERERRRRRTFFPSLSLCHSASQLGEREREEERGKRKATIAAIGKKRNGRFSYL
jgi:hypothetical protein